jgi:hypothetical protein
MQRVPRPSRRPILLTIAVTVMLALPAGVVLASHQFNDVPPGSSIHDDVEAIFNAGVTTGCGGGDYCPKANVTRGQMAQFMNRLGALDGQTPSVNADRLDGLDSSAFARPMWATINADGTIARAAQVASSVRIGSGSYGVIFNRDITQCAYIATLGSPGGGTPAAGFIVTALRAGTTNGVFVGTYSMAGAFVDSSFHLQVSCLAGSGQITLGEVRSVPDGGDGVNQP